MSMTETTIKIEFATLAEADAFNADLKQSLAQVREAIGSPFATVIAPGGIDDGAKHMRKLNGAVWYVAQRAGQDLSLNQT